MHSPQRIVSLLSSATEILCELGLAGRVVAVSHECDHPPDVLEKPRVTVAHVDSARDSGAIDRQVKQLSAAGAALYDIDRDRLRELAPDLIITQAQCDVCAVKLDDVLEFTANEPRLRGTEVIALNPASLVDVFADISKIGEATGRTDQAARLVAALEARVDRVRSKTAALVDAQRPRVACMEWIEPLMLAANWTPQLIAWAGGRAGLAAAGAHSVCHGWDEVCAYDPEVVIVAPCGFDLDRTVSEAESIAARSGWHDLAAVRNDRIFAVDGNAYLNRSGPRLVDSLEIVAHLLHPQTFAPASAGWCRLKTTAGRLVRAS